MNIMMGVWGKPVYKMEHIGLAGCALLFVGFVASIANSKIGAILGLGSSILIWIYVVPATYNEIKVLRGNHDQNVVIDISPLGFIILIGVPLILLLATGISIYSLSQTIWRNDARYR